MANSMPVVTRRPVSHTPATPGHSSRDRRSSARSVPQLFATAAVVIIAACTIRWVDMEAFAFQRGRGKRSPAPYGRIGGKPIIPNPEAEKFPAGVPRDEDGFPVISVRDQYETNVTMYQEGLGPFPGSPPDFSGDWDYIPPDPEDPDFDPHTPLGRPPPEAPEELTSLQPAGAIEWPDITPDEPIPGEAPTKRKVAAAPEASAPLPDNLSAMKAGDLRKLAEERGLPSGGTKAAVIKVLQGSE